MDRNQSPSTYEFISSHNSDVRVNLYTPAHQGVGKNMNHLSEIYQYDVTFLTRSRTENIEKYFSELYGTKHTFWLTGGATQGVLTACALLGTFNKRVAIAINSHISTISGIVLAGLDPHFIASKSPMPTASEVIAFLEVSGVSALLLTNPSYEGVTIDLAEIAHYCRQNDIALVVDESHGSHFPFLGKQWQSAITFGADIVTHSLHKYVGGLVQTALLHLPKSSRFSVEQMMGSLALFETTTRSNLLMLSIEDAINHGYSESGQNLFKQVIYECNQVRNQLDSYGRVLTYDSQVRDPFKIYLQSDCATGEELAKLLYEEGIDGEFANEEGLLLIFSFRHISQDFQLVKESLAKLVPILKKKELRNVLPPNYFNRHPQIKIFPKDAFFSPKETLPIHQALGRISSCSILKVPPGIAVLIPGEEITTWHLQNLTSDHCVEVIH